MRNMELRKAHATPFSFRSPLVRFQEVDAISSSPPAPDSVQRAEKPIHAKTFVKAARARRFLPNDLSRRQSQERLDHCHRRAGSTFRPTPPDADE
jgi:hypothetical protein